jgi:hypothetical protein
MVEGGEQLIDCVGPKRVPHLGAVEGDSHYTAFDRLVIRDVREVESRDRVPGRLVEDR